MIFHCSVEKKIISVKVNNKIKIILICKLQYFSLELNLTTNSKGKRLTVRKVDIKKIIAHHSSI